MTYPPSRWRLLLHPPDAFGDGPLNMAVDEAILEAVAAGSVPPTLRFFGWVPPCLSLGYAQPVADVDLPRLRELGYGLVRRPTGGRAILHTDELTYSVIAPMDEPRVRGGVVESYRQLSAGLLCGLQRLGVPARADREYPGAPALSAERPPNGASPVCFETPSNYEITAGQGEHGRKLLGSAQVRRRGVVLQHGTLPLTGDIGRICDVLAFASGAARQKARSRVGQRAATLAEILGRQISWPQAASALESGFAEALSLAFEAQPLSDAEWQRAQALRAEKYAAESWNSRV